MDISVGLVGPPLIHAFFTRHHLPYLTFIFPSWQEGKDKMFLIEKLTKLQDMEKRANPSALILERREMEVRSQLPWGHRTHTGILVTSALESRHKTLGFLFGFFVSVQQSLVLMYSPGWLLF